MTEDFLADDTAPLEDIEQPGEGQARDLREGRRHLDLQRRSFSDQPQCCVELLPHSTTSGCSLTVFIARSSCQIRKRQAKSRSKE